MILPVDKTGGRVCSEIMVMPHPTLFKSLAVHSYLPKVDNYYLSIVVSPCASVQFYLA